MFGRKHPSIDIRHQAVFLNQAEQAANELVQKTTELQAALVALRTKREPKDGHDHR